MIAASSIDVPAMRWHIATPWRADDERQFRRAKTMTASSIRPWKSATFRNPISTKLAATIASSSTPIPRDYDMEKIVAMLHKIVAAATTWMDDRPFDSYMFLYHFPRGPAAAAWSTPTRPPSTSERR